MSLFGIGRDWVRAPISGTAILVCYVGAAVMFYRGDTNSMLLYALIAEVLGMRRDKYLEDTE